jgi:glycosyltransferase involved in cell wall biosynthesis
LKQSLSVLLPVHNAQATLAAKVDEILDLLLELTDRFELLITDDASTDGTWEVVRDLARRYPQVRLLRETVRRGPGCAIREGTAVSQGDIVIAHNGQPGIDPRAIARLWRSAVNGGDMEQNDGFRLLRPGAIASLRRTVDATRTQTPGGASSPSQSNVAERSAGQGEPKARRPNFLSREKSHGRGSVARN